MNVILSLCFIILKLTWCSKYGPWKSAATLHLSNFKYSTERAQWAHQQRPIVDQHRIRNYNNLVKEMPNIILVLVIRIDEYLNIRVGIRIRVRLTDSNKRKSFPNILFLPEK